jgi:hypothetical protein
VNDRAAAAFSPSPSPSGRPETKGENMSLDDDLRKVRVLESWKQTARDEVDNIGAWRNASKKKLQKYHWTEPQSFYRETVEVCRIVGDARALPIQVVGAAVERWHERHSAAGLAKQAPLESALAEAVIVVNGLIEDFRRRISAVSERRRKGLLRKEQGPYTAMLVLWERRAYSEATGLTGKELAKAGAGSEKLAKQYNKYVRKLQKLGWAETFVGRGGCSCLTDAGRAKAQETFAPEKVP